MVRIDVNGTLQDGDLAFAGIGHRGLNYGDGLFETIRMADGQTPYLDTHLERLTRGMKILKISVPDNYTTEYFNKRIKLLSEGHVFGRVRLSVFRAAGGLYTPERNIPEYVLTFKPSQDDSWGWSSARLKLGICPVVQLPVNILSGLKTANALPYILAGIWIEEQKLDECILLNQMGEVAEAGRSNIFYFKNNKLFTPEDQAGGVNGVMRKLIVGECKKKGIPVIKKKVRIGELLCADEVFLTNAIRGVQSVERINDSLFSNTLSSYYFNPLKAFMAG